MTAQIEVERPGSADDRTDRPVLPVALGLALLPLVVSAVVLVVDVGSSYLPTSDLALTEMQVRDVGREDVLNGLYSRADWRHPGPILFYLLAPLYWLTGNASIAINLGALLINGAAIAGMAVVARRRGGTPLVLCTLLGCALLVRTLGADFVHDPWNNSVTVLPFGLMIFLAWALTCGDVWALPAAAAVASFLAQTHVGFLALALPLLAWGVLWLALRAIRSTDGRRRDLLRSGSVSAAVLAVLWLPPLIDVVLNAPSNAQRIWQWFRLEEGGAHTIAEGWRVVRAQFGVPPEWLFDARAPSPFSGEPLFIVSAPIPWLLGLLVLATWSFWRRRVADGWRLALTVSLAIALGVVAVARTVGPAFDYRLRWTWVVGMAGFVVLIWAGWLAIARRWPQAGSRSLVAASVTGLVLVGDASTVSAVRAGTPEEPDTSILAAVAEPTLQALGRGEGAVLVTDTLAGSWYARGLVLQLERHGIDALVPPERAVLFGEHRAHEGEPIRARLVVAVDAEVTELAEQSGLRLLATTVPITELPSLERELRDGLADLDAEYEAGRLDTETWIEEGRDLQARVLPRRGNAAMYAVAVFLDERTVG